MGSFAVFIVGMSFSVVTSLFAAILSQFASRKTARIRFSRNPEAILLTLGPFWFIVLSCLIGCYF